MNNKTLALIFGALVLIYILTRLFSGSNDRSFDPNNLQVDTSKVDGIVMDLLEGEDYRLEKSGGVWKGYKGDMTVEVESSSVSSMLAQVATMKTLRITTKDQSKWPNFEIDDTQAKANVTFKSGNKELKTLIIGGFRFNQEARTAQSFIRTTEGEEVYAVDGFTSMSLGQSLDNYRDKTMLKVDKESITAVDINSPDSNFGIQKSIGGWVGSDGELLDSTKVANYVQSLSNYRAVGFNDQYNKTGDFTHTIAIHSNTQPTPFQIHLVPVEGFEKPFVLESTQRPNVVFSGDSTATYNGLIKTKADFLN